MIQGSVEEFAKTPKGQEFLGWGWDGVSTVEVNGEVHPADENGVQMYDSPTAFLDNLLSGSGISNLLSAQPEAPRQRATTGAQIVPQTTTTGGSKTIAEDLDDIDAGISGTQSSEVLAPYASQPGGSYKIEQGDTLWDIAQQHNTTVDDLMRANPNIQDRDRIMAGGMLNVPELADDPANIANQIDPQANAIAQRLDDGADLSPPQLMTSPMAEWDNWAPTAAAATTALQTRPVNAPVNTSPADASNVAVTNTSAPIDANQSAAPQAGTSNAVTSNHPIVNVLRAVGSGIQDFGSGMRTALNTPRKPTYVAPHMQGRQRKQAVSEY